VNIIRVFKPGAADQQELLAVLESLLNEQPGVESAGPPAQTDPPKPVV
jgi:hypothetical protein